MKLRVFGDLHYSTNYKSVEGFHERREAYFNHFFQQLFSQPADYYISIGDLTNTGYIEEFNGVQSFIQKYDQQNKFQFTVGNHDAYGPTKAEISAHMKTDLYRVIVQDNLCMIFLDTVRQQNVMDWSGYMDQEQLSWLEETLAAHSDKTVIIFAHHPIYDTTLFSTDDKNSIIPEIPIMDILNKHLGKAFYICGHVHADSIVQVNNWTFVQIAAVIDQPTIRDIEIDDHHFTIQTTNISEEYRQIGNWLGSNMLFFGMSVEGYQGLENRNISLEF